MDMCLDESNIQELVKLYNHDENGDNIDSKLASGAHEKF